MTFIVVKAWEWECIWFLMDKSQGCCQTCRTTHNAYSGQNANIAKAGKSLDLWSTGTNFSFDGLVEYNNVAFLKNNRYCRVLVKDVLKKCYPRCWVYGSVAWCMLEVWCSIPSSPSPPLKKKTQLFPHKSLICSWFTIIRHLASFSMVCPIFTFLWENEYIVKNLLENIHKIFE